MFETLRVPAGSAHGGQTAADIIDMGSHIPSHLYARDELKQCRRWEESLTPSMKAARVGDFDMFIAEVTPNSLSETDYHGYDIWFWAFVGGCERIIDYLFDVPGSLQRLFHVTIVSTDESRI